LKKFPHYEEMDEMSISDEDMNISFKPCALIRTLSVQHWIAADTEMAQKRRKVQWAGTSGDWEYLVRRENSTTRTAQHETSYRDEVKATDNVILPIAHRCLGRRKDGRRCRQKVYWLYCKRHSPKSFGHGYERLSEQGVC
jgi:hypothetical protein